MDYSEFGLNSNLRAKTSLSERNSKQISPLEFDSLYDVYTNKLTASKVNLVDFVKVSDLGTAVGTFSSSQTLQITARLTYLTPHIDNPIFAIPMFSIYQGAGTSTATQIFPRIGTSVTIGRYDVQAAHDITGWGGTSAWYGASITDTNGTSTQAITVSIKWKFLDYRSSNTLPSTT